MKKQIYSAGTSGSLVKIKNLICVFALWLICSQASAQTVTTYSYAQSVNAAGYAALATGTTLSTGTGAGSSNSFYQGGAVNTAGSGIPIGFNFIYNCGTYTTLGVHTNGFVWFGSGTPATNVTKIWEQNANLNGSGTINGVIAAYSGHSNAGGTATTLTPSAAGSYIRYQLSGVSPNQIFKIEWRGYVVQTNASNATVPAYEIWLFESNSKIEIHVMNQNSLFLSNTSYGQAGIRGTSNADLKNLSIPFTAPNNTWSIPATTATTTATLPIDGAVWAIYSNPAPSSTGERIFTFTPTQSCCTQPTTGATAFASSNLVPLTSTATVTFDRGNGDGGVIAIIKDGSAPSGPANGTVPGPANVNYGSGAAVGGGFLIFSESGSGSGTRTVNLTGLTSGHSYYIAVYEYNAAATCYISTPLSGGFCFGPPSVATVVSSVNPVCQGSSATLSLTSLSPGTFYTYQWQNSATSGSGYGNSSGTATNSTYATPTTLPSNPAYYVCQVTCPNTSNTTQSNELAESINSFLNCYCTSSLYAATATAARGIVNVNLVGNSVTINNTTTANTVSPFYNLYSTPVADLSASSAYSLKVTVGTQTTNNFGTAWIDFDQSGTFGGYNSVGTPVLGGDYNAGLALERVGSFGPVAGSVQSTLNFTVPSTAAIGTTAMRVRYRYNSSIATLDACAQATGAATTGGAGETEDYRVTISSCLPPTVQASGNSMGPINTTDATINWSGNGNGNAVIVVVNPVSAPAGPSQTTSYTGNSNFPSAPITSGTSRVVYTGTGSSVNVTGLSTNVTYFYAIYTYFTGTNCYMVSSPASGSFTTANSPMTYISGTTTQAVISSVTPNSANNQIIGVQVVTSTGTSPALNLTSLTFNTNGSTNVVDITAAKVWYTGTSSTFATTTQFGSTVSNPSGSNTVSGSQALSAGTNYFWVTYDIAATPTATVGDVVDAECTSINVGGAQTPSVTAPSGSRTILLNYCTPSPGAGPCSLGGDDAILSATYTGTNSTFNYTGGSCANGTYGMDSYTGNIDIGGTYTTTLVKGNNGGPSSSFGARFIVFMDLNNDGDFTDNVSGTNEMVMDVTQSAASATSASFTIPSTGVNAGSHRIRVWIGYTGTIVPSDIASVVTGCEVLSAGFNQGQIRDFNINLVGGCSAPAFTTCPGNISLNTTPGLCSAVGTYTTVVSGTTPAVTYAFTGATTGSGSGDGSGSAFNAGTTVVTATATNGCGTAPCTFNVVVTDNQNPVPVIAVLPDITGECSATATAPTATDNCAGTITASTIDPTSYNTQGSFVIHWTYDDGNGNTVTQNQNVIIDDVTNPTINNCPGNISSCNPVVSWTAPTASDNCGTASLSSNFNPGATFALGTTTVTYTADDGNGNTATCSFTVTVIANPTAVISNNSSICLGQPATIHLVFTGTGPWNYTVSDGSQTVSGTAATSPVNINITPVSTGVHNYTVTVLSDVNCPGTGSGTATVAVSSTLPANSIGTVNGPGEACIGSIVLISTNIVSGQNITYSWNTGSYSSVVKYSTTAGGPFVTGPFLTTIPSVYVEFGALAGSSGYNICVQAVNGCGSTNNKCSWVRGIVSVPGNISGSVVACQNDVKNYSCGLSNGASLYTWTLSGSSSPVTSGQGSPNVSVTFPPAFTSGQLCVTAALACGGSSTSAPRCMTISNTPAIPGSMTGPSKVCPGATGVAFSIPAVAGATGYNWIVPAGATITSGANTTAITVNFPASYTGAPPVCVYALSSCASSAGRCKTVGTNLPGQPGSITGPTSGVCNSTVQYSINSVTLATSYTWTIPAGSTNFLGQGSTSIQFTVPPSPFASGQVTVVANTTACTPGTSTPRTITINGAPSLPGAISAFPSAWCDGGFVNFSITPASPLPVYQWIVTNGTIDAGQNSTNIDVTWGIGAGIVKVRATNSCGASGYRTLNTSSVCRELSRFTQEDHLSVYPNPAHDKVTVEMNNSIDEKAEINITDLTGKLIFKEQMQISMGITAIEIDLAHFAKGAYIISIMKTSGVKRQGIMIQ
ncbi:MAG TPA: GEVED domain-containing protein [Bacteroidia bacterium]|nr:GEVED domain-containing protein [Bacteroidia bacterium]